MKLNEWMNFCAKSEEALRLRTAGVDLQEATSARLKSRALIHRNFRGRFPSRFYEGWLGRSGSGLCGIDSVLHIPDRAIDRAFGLID